MTTKASPMMWVSSTTKRNKQDGKNLAKLKNVQKWVKAKSEPPKGSF